MNRVWARLLRRVFRHADLGRWRLPFEYYVHVLDGMREPELKYLSKICRATGTAVDVGANVGYYTFVMAHRFERVYAFEVNPDVSEPIRRSGLENVHLVDEGLSSSSGKSVLHIPVVDALPLTGWASLERGNCPSASHYLERPVSLVTLDTFELDGVDLIKIDVEGHELQVLEGAISTIANSHPALVVEIKPRRFEAVQAFLRRHGYGVRLLEDLTGEPGSPENFIFTV